jgi:hypothetical protein
MDRYLAPPIGIFVCQDLYCRHLIDICKSKGLDVSQDVAIVGTHNETEICNAPAPSLTSIDLGFGRIGYQAATDAGFRSADHFYKVFTRVEGMPPSQYRDEHQKAFPERV